MFREVSKNVLMLEGAYRKLKSYYYYNKNFLIMRKKIADFEEDRKSMYDIFEKLALLLCRPKKMRQYLNDLINQIDFFVIPKKFERYNQDGS